MRRELRRGGDLVPLTPLEFRLLMAFIRYRGRALGRQRLIDEVWGHDTFVIGRVVDTQITNLRKKMSPALPNHATSSACAGSGIGSMGER